MEELKVRFINAHQLYRLLFEPNFAKMAKSSPVSVRRMVLRGEFGQPIITPAGRKRSILVDLSSAYGHAFSKIMSRKTFIESVNRWIDNMGSY